MRTRVIVPCLAGPWNGMTWGMNKDYGNFDYWLESSATIPPTSGWKVDNAGPAGGCGVPPAPSVQVLSATVMGA